MEAQSIEVGLAPHRVGVVFVGALFVFAGVTKVASPGEFTQIVRTLLGQEPGWRWVYAVGAVVIAWELALGCALMLCSWHRAVLAAGMATVVGLTAVLVLMLFRHPESPCGCFGVVWDGAMADSRVGLARNGLMLAVLWAALPRGGEGIRESRSAPRGPRGGRAKFRCGFTIVEVMVVIVITTVLLSLALPGIGQARQSARDVSSGSHARQVFAALVMYQADEKDAFPYFATPGEPQAPIYVKEYMLPTAAYFRGQSQLYTSLLTNYLESMERLAPPWSTAEWANPAQGVYATRYFLAHAAFAESSYWVDDDAPMTAEACRGTRWADIAFPASKGVILDIAGAGFSRSFGAARVDASWAAHEVVSVGCDGAARRTRMNFESGESVVSRPFAAIPWPVLSTRNGWRGRDY